MHIKPIPALKNMSQAGLQAFFKISALWDLSTEQEMVLLGSPARSTFFEWKRHKSAKLSHDTLERISYILGIYKALRMLLPTEQAANAWIKKANSATLFNQHSALDIMLQGNVADLADVRRYLDAQRG